MSGAAGGPVLAVDGGGVKTDLALLDAQGTLLAHVRGGSSQAYYLGADGCAAVIEELLGTAAAQAGLDPDARPLAGTGALLLAGMDTPEEIAALRDAVQARRLCERMDVGNDTDALLRAGTDRGWGVAVGCGTGINCLGRDPDGREARFLSFGEVSGDWGGGTDVGIAALAAAVRAADGRGPETLLRDAVPAHFGLSDPVAVAHAVHLGGMDQTRLGELVSVVLDVCEEDASAAAIVTRLGEEVAAFARAALRRLALESADPDVVLGGRLLRMMPAGVVETIMGGIHDVAPRAHVFVSPSEPIVGAALLGLDAVGAGAEAVMRARAQLDRATASLATR